MVVAESESACLCENVLDYCIVTALQLQEQLQNRTKETSSKGSTFLHLSR